MIQRLGPDDAHLFAALNAMFAVAFEDADAYAGAPPSAEYLTALLAKDHIHALVARQDGAVIGGLVAYEFDKFERARREMYIYDLAVLEPARRKGIATDLIAHLRDIARARGVYVIMVQADLGDDPAITLYTKLGQREDVLHFDIAP